MLMTPFPLDAVTTILIYCIQGSLFYHPVMAFPAFFLIFTTSTWAFIAKGEPQEGNKSRFIPLDSWLYCNHYTFGDLETRDFALSLDDDARAGYDHDVQAEQALLLQNCIPSIVFL